MNEDLEQWDVRKRAAADPRGVVAAQHVLAARAGAAMLHAGGNAVDAAVACAFALGVVEPWMCGLGGSGYMVVWRAADRKAEVVDFQGVLPAAIDTADYPLDTSVPDSLMGFPGVKDNRNVVGYAAATVPGAVAGLALGLERFGTMGLDRVLDPAITLARRGLPVSWFTTLHVALAMANLRKDATAAAIYLPDGVPLQPETHRPLGALAGTLQTLAENGPDAFYRGRLGELIAEDLQAGGSRITLDDLAGYRAILHAPLSGSHRGAGVHTAGESSGGPRLIEALGRIGEDLDPSLGIGAHTYLTYARALNAAFRSHKIKIGRIAEGGCTSHMSAVDADGNMVALTYTLLNRFGAHVVLPQTGILMNNAVSYFDPRPGFPTSMEGDKRINASNMCPTIAVHTDGAGFAVGASGANHIVPCTTQVAALLLDYGLDLETAFNTPRIDAGDRESVRVDPAVGAAVIEEMARHFTLEVAQQLVFPKLYSCPSAVSFDPDAGVCTGISDKSVPVAGAATPAPFRLDADGAAATRA